MPCINSEKCAWVEQSPKNHCKTKYSRDSRGILKSSFFQGRHIQLPSSYEGLEESSDPRALNLHKKGKQKTNGWNLKGLGSGKINKSSLTSDGQRVLRSSVIISFHGVGARESDSFGERKNKFGGKS